MGVIEQTRGLINMAEDRGYKAIQDEKDLIVNNALTEMSEVLEQPEYVGDLDVALVHHLGRAAFTTDQAKPFKAFAEAIIENSEEVIEPILVTVNPVENAFTEPGAAYTSFIMVEPAALGFRSVTSRREAVKMHAFTNETAGVTDKTLSLIGRVTSIGGDLQDRGSLRADVQTEDGLILAVSHTADENRGKGQGAHAFKDSTTNYVSLNDWDEPYVTVGWEAIERAVLDATKSNVGGLLAVQALFNTGTGRNGWKKHMPQLASQVRAAVRLSPAPSR